MWTPRANSASTPPPPPGYRFNLLSERIKGIRKTPGHHTIPSSQELKPCPAASIFYKEQRTQDGRNSSWQAWWKPNMPEAEQDVPTGLTSFSHNTQWSQESHGPSEASRGLGVLGCNCTSTWQVEAWLSGIQGYHNLATSKFEDNWVSWDTIS